MSTLTKKLMNNRYKNACRKMGIENPLEFQLEKPYSKWLNLILTAKEIEAPRKINNDNAIFVGPCFMAKRIDEKSNFPFGDLKPSIKKVYVSLGTVFNNKPDVFKKIIYGIEKENLQIIVSAGGAYEKLLKYNFDKNVMLFKSVPQLEVLKKADLVISHGGNNTINETFTDFERKERSKYD